MRIAVLRAVLRAVLIAFNSKQKRGFGMHFSG